VLTVIELASNIPFEQAPKSREQTVIVFTIIFCLFLVI